MKKQITFVDFDMRNVYVPLFSMLEEKNKIDYLRQVVLFKSFYRDEQLYNVCAGKCKNLFAVYKKGIEKDIFSELIESKAPQYTDEPVFYNEMSGKNMYKWMNVVIALAALLELKVCPQIIFNSMSNGTGYMKEMNMVFVEHYPDSNISRENDFDMLVFLAHELRHAWQYENGFENPKDYIRHEDDELGYFLQRAEVDAEVFAQRLGKEIYGIQYVIDNPTIKEAYEEYDKELKIGGNSDFDMRMNWLKALLFDEEFF